MLASIQPLFIKIFQVEIGGRICDSRIVMVMPPFSQSFQILAYLLFMFNG